MSISITELKARLEALLSRAILLEKTDTRLAQEYFAEALELEEKINGLS